jgi:hypothetical protein
MTMEVLTTQMTLESMDILTARMTRTVIANLEAMETPSTNRPIVTLIMTARRTKKMTEALTTRETRTARNG